MIKHDMASNLSRKRHLRGLARMSAYLVGLGVVFAGFQVRAVHAELKRRTLELGRDMVKLADASNQELNQIVFNGQSMWLGSTTSTSPVADVLDRYESYCKQNRAQSAEEWRALSSAKADVPVDPAKLGSGVLRESTDHDGMVLCFVKSSMSKPTLLESMKAFSETGELGTIGAARYVFAKKTEKGQTLVLTSWTDDTFNIQKMLPEEGKDVPGADFTDIPRVGGDAMRILSARVEGTPFGLNIYRTNEAPAAIASFYDKEMKQRGWFVFDPEVPDRGADGKPIVGRLYEKDGVVLTLGTNVEQGATFAALGLAGVEGSASNAPRATR